MKNGLRGGDAAKPLLLRVQLTCFRAVGAEAGAAPEPGVAGSAGFTATGAEAERGGLFSASLRSLIDFDS